MSDKPEVHIAQFIVYTDSALVASRVAVKAGKAAKKGKAKGYCIDKGKRVYWRLRTKK